MESTYCQCGYQENRPVNYSQAGGGHFSLEVSISVVILTLGPKSAIRTHNAGTALFWGINLIRYWDWLYVLVG